MDHAFAASKVFGQEPPDAVPGVTRMALDQLIPACKVAQAPSLMDEKQKKTAGRLLYINIRLRA
jgi:hypothetical protein